MSEPIKRWTDGHKHMWRYFGGMASCIECAATLAPDGTIGAPTRRSKAHRLRGARAVAAGREERARRAFEGPNYQRGGGKR